MKTFSESATFARSASLSYPEASGLQKSQLRRVADRGLFGVFGAPAFQCGVNGGGDGGEKGSETGLMNVQQSV